MFCDRCGAAVPADAVSCAKCGHALLPGGPAVPRSIGRSGLPYRWGRFFAGLQIAGGLLLLALLNFFWHQLDPRTRHLMLTGIVVALPLGYGLWKKTRWALYLLTVVFVVEIGIWIEGFRHGAFRPVLALYLHALMVYYCWRRQPDFV